MVFPFQLPPLSKNGPVPEWTGKRFKIGDAFEKVLHYSSNEAGWNDDLTHFIFEDVSDADFFMNKASRMHTLNQLKKHIDCTNPTILEIGCATGFMLHDLCNQFPQATILGSDIIYTPLLKLAENLPVPLLRFDLLQCPLPDNCLDAIILLNVLEHIENDDLALEQIYRILKPEGILIVEVPAGPHLYDIQDKVLLHYRRYVLKKLRDQVLGKHFKVLHASHLGVFVYPAFWLIKKRNQRFFNQPPIEQRKKLAKAIKESNKKNKLLLNIMNLELNLGRYLTYPFGIRCLITCKK